MTLSNKEKGEILARLGKSDAWSELRTDGQLVVDRDKLLNFIITELSRILEEKKGAVERLSAYEHMKGDSESDALVFRHEVLQILSNEEK